MKQTSKKGGEHPTPKNQRSDVKNPTSDAFIDDAKNQLIQVKVKDAPTKEVGKQPTPNDQRSVVKNPTSDAFKADFKNRLNQLKDKNGPTKEGEK